MKLPIEKANYKQLVGHAQLLGLDVKHGSINQVDLLALLRETHPGLTEIDIADSDVVHDAAPARAGSASTHYSNDPKVVVNISSDELGGNHPLSIGNGPDHLLVKRDVNVAIPYRHFRILQTAVETVMRQEVNPMTGAFETHTSDQNAVRYTVVEMPSPAEIEAYHARCRDVGAEAKRKAA